MRGFATLMLGAALLATAAPALATSRYVAYVGTYTDGKAKGVYSLHYDAASKTFVSLGVEAEVASPSFVAVSPSHKFLYAVTERSARRDSSGALSSYAIDPASGALKLINRVPAHGNTSAHLVVDHTGKWLLLANYGSGSVATFPLNADGSIGEISDFKQHSGSSVNAHRQMGPHPHEIVLSGDNRFAYVPDLGLDKVFVYALDVATGKLTLASTTDTRPGFGPRHMLLGKSGMFAYVLGEMGSAVTVMARDKATGKLTPGQIIDTVPPGLTEENNSAELAMSTDGRFLYATNRGHDSVTVFSINGRNGQLTNVQNIPTQGHIPRGMALDPDGTHLLTGNQNSDTITVFDRDTKTGKLTFASLMTDIPTAVCILFTPLD